MSGSVGLVWAREPLPGDGLAVFLAGPTPCAGGTRSWRRAAFEEIGAQYTGNKALTVLTPESRDGHRADRYEDQVTWETEARLRADAVLFWIPRDLRHLPGFTTNVEFGHDVTSGRAVLGCPPDCPNPEGNRYLIWLAHQHSVPVTETLPDTVAAALTLATQRDTTDPTQIDWSHRQARAAIPFQVIDGRPVNPCQSTGIRHGRNQLGHWGEALAADVLVTSTDPHGRRWIVMVERGDGHGWALPGGRVDPGETPQQAAVRELAEETGLTVHGQPWRSHPPQYVPDPRASDEAWMVTVLHTTHQEWCDDLTWYPPAESLGEIRQAAMIRADTYQTLTDYLAETYGDQVFAAHIDMLTQALS